MYILETYIKLSSVQFHLTFLWLILCPPSLHSASYKVLLLLCIGTGEVGYEQGG